jgi:hypothetical protein
MMAPYLAGGPESRPTVILALEPCGEMSFPPRAVRVSLCLLAGARRRAKCTDMPLQELSNPAAGVVLAGGMCCMRRRGAPLRERRAKPR